MLVAHPRTGRIHDVSENVAELLIKQNGFTLVYERPQTTDRIMRENRARWL